MTELEEKLEVVWGSAGLLVDWRPLLQMRAVYLPRDAGESGVGVDEDDGNEQEKPANGELKPSETGSVCHACGLVS